MLSETTVYDKLTVDKLVFYYSCERDRKEEKERTLAGIRNIVVVLVGRSANRLHSFFVAFSSFFGLHTQIVG